MATYHGGSREQQTKNLSLIRSEQCYCLIVQSRFDMLSKDVQAKAHAADAETLRIVGVGVDEQTKEVYLFTSEQRLVNGIRTLQQTVPRFSRKPFRNVCADPLLVLQAVDSFGHSKVFVDTGAKTEFTIPGTRVSSVLRLAEIDRIANRDAFYIVENDNGFAVTMEIEDEQYAIAYLTEAEALETLDGLKQSNPGARLAKNRPIDVASSIYQSEVKGIVFNPASETQEVLDDIDIKRLIFACTTRVSMPKWAKRALELIGVE